MIIDGIPFGLVYDVVLYQGRTFEQEFLVREADESTPVPLTGYAGYAEMKTRPGGTVIMVFEVTVNQAAGSVIMRAGATATDAVTKGGSYDLALIRTDGATPIVIPFAEGTVSLNKQVTDVVPFTDYP